MNSAELQFPWRIKICGVTSPAEAEAIAAAGADAIGINFYQRSMRNVRMDVARTIVAACQNHGLTPVGLFVNDDPRTILEKATSLGLTWLQLHGDENPDCCRQLQGFRIVRAIRLRQGQANAAIDEGQRWLDEGARALLIDAPFPVPAKRDDDEDETAVAASLGESPASDSRVFGGTGSTVDWVAAGVVISSIQAPVILAGGLTPSNVRRAIQQSGVRSVDVASGVEGFPGRKDLRLVRAFVEQARTAWS